MPVSLLRLWDWADEAAGYDRLAASGDGRLLAFSPNSGVVGLRLRTTEAELVWRFPDPPGESLDLVGALGGPEGTRVFVAFQQAWSSSTVRALDTADGTLAWQRELGQGVVYSLAADTRQVYLHRGTRAGHLLQVLDAATGHELNQLPLPEAITPLVTPTTGGTVLYGAATDIVAYDSVTATSHVLAAAVLRPTGGQQLGSVIASESRVYATDGLVAVVAIDRAAGGGVRWRQALPGRPDPGALFYDAALEALFVCCLSGETYCLAADSGAIRWVSHCSGASTAETSGVPTVVRSAAGTFVAYPGVDESLYLADAATGAIVDSVACTWPLECALHARADTLFIPHPLGVSAFALRG